jgi:hypothetical protein
MTQYAAPLSTQPAQSWVLPAAAPAYAADARSRSGLAILSLLMSLLALLAVLGLAAWMVVTGAAPLPGRTQGPLTGRLAAVPTNGALPGATLATAMTKRLEENGAAVSSLKCPETARIGQGVVTVCHGSIDGGAASVVVVFESRDGDFTLLSA